MSDDEEKLCKFGTPLDPLEEDEIPSKKPIGIEDQIAVDSNGRRRFHGAFTGGFSAGFWNTVGSLEGWKPQEFKSSRSEKASRQTQRIEDFMDDEDVGEFGIAPQRVQAKDDFKPQSSLNKRKAVKHDSSGPIPGMPVLHTLLEPPKENIGIRLIKKMGWKEGQGVGARQTRKEKKQAKERNAKEMYILKKYGCDIGSLNENETIKNSDTDDDSDFSDTEITFAPDDFDPFVISPKDNTFGLGYSGLNRKPVLQRFNLFAPLEVVDKNNKKLSISGQAFGVGAFEEEDDDIYAKDDMSRYDFSLDDKKKKKEKEIKAIADDVTVIEGFKAENSMRHSPRVFDVQIPLNFKPRNWLHRRTRFEPLDENVARELEEKNAYKVKGLGRHDLKPDERGRLLNEDSSSIATYSQQQEKPPIKVDKKTELLRKINEKYGGFQKGEIINNDVDKEQKSETEVIQSEAAKITENLKTSRPSIFKPFILDDAKQERYEKFLLLKNKDNDSMDKFLKDIQPTFMSDWDREMERKEFIQARNMYKPLAGLMSDRFVSETTAELTVPKEKETPQVKQIKMIRNKIMWKPCSTLCKRFNIPEPYGGSMKEEEKPKKTTRFSVFDYLENSVNTKSNFVTPVIIPSKLDKSAEKQAEIIEKETKNVMDNVVEGAKLEFNKTLSSEDVECVVTKNKTETRLTAKDIFSKEISLCKESSKTEIAKKGMYVSPSETKSKKSEGKKTELEIKVIKAIDKRPVDKKDLFKAIFESSSESEDDADDKTKNNEISSSQSLLNIPKELPINKSATELNILRNTSPPRGIFANLFTKSGPNGTNKEKSKEVDKNEDIIIQEDDNIYGPQLLTQSTSLATASTSTKEPTMKVENNQQPKIIFRRKEERNQSESSLVSDNYFGPKLPEAIKLSDSFLGNKLDDKLEKLINKKETVVIEKWIEKDKIEKRKKKNKEKHKKSKKHKKDKKKSKEK